MRCVWRLKSPSRLPPQSDGTVGNSWVGRPHPPKPPASSIPPVASCGCHLPVCGPAVACLSGLFFPSQQSTRDGILGDKESRHQGQGVHLLVKPTLGNRQEPAHHPINTHLSPEMAVPPNVSPSAFNLSAARSPHRGMLIALSSSPREDLCYFCNQRLGERWLGSLGSPGLLFLMQHCSRQGCRDSHFHTEPIQGFSAAWLEYGVGRAS